jgi:hypothetical protein
LAPAVSVFALLLLCNPAFGQEVRGTITGTVADPTGAPIAGTKVASTRTLSIQPQLTMPGCMSFLYFCPVNYSVAVSHQGFSRAESPRLLLTANQRLEQDFRLQVGSATSFLLATLTAAVFSPSIDSINSIRPFDNGGMDNMQINGGLSYRNVNVDLKSGTNQFHGAGVRLHTQYDFQYESLGNNANGSPRQAYHRQQPGIELDGPLYIPKLYDGRNKTFFMFSWDSIKDGIPHALSVARRGFINGLGHRRGTNKADRFDVGMLQQSVGRDPVALYYVENAIGQARLG